MKTKTLLEALLLEHINVEGAEYIQTVQGYDIFKITTYAAAQEFVSAQAHTPAGQKWTQNENEFNNHIHGDMMLYFIVNADTNEVLAAVLTQNGNHTINAPEGAFTSNYALENEQGNNTVAFSIHIIEAVPGININFIPDEEEVADNDANDEPEEVIDDEEINDQEHENNTGDDEEIFYCWDEDWDGKGGIILVDEFETLEEAKKYCMETEGAYLISTDGDRENIIWRKPQYKTPDIKIRIINGEGVVVGCRKQSYGNLNIPETFNDYPVTTIASYALYNIRANSIYCPSIIKFEKKAIYSAIHYWADVYIRRDAKKYNNSINNCNVRIKY